MNNKIEELYKRLISVNYGWFDKDNKLHTDLKGNEFKQKYRMQDKAEVYNSNYGICWELCEIEREFFEKNKMEYATIFAVLNDGKRNPCHTFLVYKLDNKMYWFEASWKKQRGLKEFKSLEEVFNTIKDNFDEFTKEKYNKDEICFYKYSKPPKNSGCVKYYCYCRLFGKKLKPSTKLFK